MPYSDEDIEINVEIKKGLSKETFTYDRTLLSLTLANYKTSIYIDMNESISNINKDTYLTMSTDVISEINDQEQYLLDNQTGGIKGRGNSTWYSYPKKPYKLKFDERVSILGMPDAKEYVLLAEYADPSLMRNVITHQLSKMFNLRHTLETRYVDLYINHQYLGVYVLTEQVEVDKNKLDLTIDGDINNLSFFIEIDMRYDDYTSIDPKAWISLNNFYYEVKELDPDDIGYSLTYRDSIKTYLSQTYDSLILNNGYDDYANIDEWIDYFIVQEISKNVDSWYSSVFMYKDKDNLLCFGPLWDFDFAYGNADYIDYGYEGFYGLRSDKNIWFHEMMKLPEVREKFKTRYIEFYLTYKDQYLNMITSLYLSLQDNSIDDNVVWQRLGLSVWPNPVEITSGTTYFNQYDYLYTYVENRLDWLKDAVLSDLYAQGQFDNI